MASMRSENPYELHPVSQKFPPTLPWKQIQWLSDASAFHASLLQAIEGMMSLASCSQVVSQAPQHLRSPETQTTCDAKRLPVYLFGHFHPLWHVQGSTSKGVFVGGCWTLTHATFNILKILCHRERVDQGGARTRSHSNLLFPYPLHHNVVSQ